MSGAGRGFYSEEALQNHIQEDHVRPYEDPGKFLEESLAEVLGMGADGKVKMEMSAPPMASVPSAQGQTMTPMTRTDSGATPMSREASMKRQASGPGANQDVSIKQAPQDAWSGGGVTVDPQSLFANLGGAELAKVGVVPTDITTYRSVTPNDTPESIKDSGSSEPNSDISEHAGLDIDLTFWQPFPDSDLTLDMSQFNVSQVAKDGGVSEDVLMESLLMDSSDGAGMQDMTNWADLDMDFNVPLTLDTSLYSLNTS